MLQAANRIDLKGILIESGRTHIRQAIVPRLHCWQFSCNLLSAYSRPDASIDVDVLCVWLQQQCRHRALAIAGSDWNGLDQGSESPTAYHRSLQTCPGKNSHRVPGRND